MTQCYICLDVEGKMYKPCLTSNCQCLAHNECLTKQYVAGYKRCVICNEKMIVQEIITYDYLKQLYNISLFILIIIGIFLIIFKYTGGKFIIILVIIPVITRYLFLYWDVRIYGKQFEFCCGMLCFTIFFIYVMLIIIVFKKVPLYNDVFYDTKIVKCKFGS